MAALLSLIAHLLLEFLGNVDIGKVPDTWPTRDNEDMSMIRYTNDSLPCYLSV